MRTVLELAIAMAVVTTAAALSGAALAGAAPTNDPASAFDSPDQDEIIVTGRIGELRQQLWSAEEAVFARFNEINSSDDFDVHCSWEARTGSRILARRCASNVWREDDADYAQATLREMRGEADTPPGAYLAHQEMMQDRLRDEMRRLAIQDPQLSQAVTHLGKAQLAYSAEAGTARDLSVSLQVEPGPDGLPFAARREFAVRMGRETWSHPLTERTFTLAQVSGDIRRLDVRCAEGREHLDYRAGVEWTLPSGWTTCTLHVDAKRDTTFALFEFPSP